MTDAGVSIELSDEQAEKSARWMLEKLGGARSSSADAELSRDLHDDGVF